jgi:glycosyltransferase involved in cell wall biosynthesis
MSDQVNQRDISIIITNYNQGKFLKGCVDSVLSDPYNTENCELIIVDDGSTDDSLATIIEIVNEISHIIPAQFVSKRNGGTASARNEGVKKADGKAIAFLDVDDLYLPGKVEKSVRIMKKYPNIGVVYTDYIEDMMGQKQIVNFKQPYSRDGLFKQCMVSTNSVVSKLLFNYINGFDEGIRGCEDYDFWLRASNTPYTLFHIAEPLFLYRNHAENKTNTYGQTQEWGEEELMAKKRASKGIYYV